MISGHRGGVGASLLVRWVLPTALLLYIGAFDLLLEDRWTLGQSVLLPLALALGILCVSPNELRAGRVFLLTTAVVAWEAATVLWSIDASTSFFVLRTEILTSLLVMIVAGLLTLSDLRRLLVSIATVSIVASTMSLVLLPAARGLSAADLVVPGTTNAWRGLYPHKNPLGIWTGIHVVTLVLLRPRGGSATSNRRINLVIFLGVVLVIGSRTTTGLLTLIAGLALGVALRAMARRGIKPGRALLTGILAFGIGVVVLTQNLVTVLSWFGKDPTFTGRTRIWSATLAEWRLRPWRGYGPAGFWLTNNEHIARVTGKIHFYIAEAHQGAIDVLLLYGAVGLVLVVTLIFMTIKAALWVARFDLELGLAIVCIIFMLLMASLSEATLSRGPLLFIVALATATFSGQARHRVALADDRPPEPRRAVLQADRETAR